MDFYVYYQVEEKNAQALQVRIIEMQQNLRASLGVESALKRRPATFDNIQTWMEIYLAVPGNFDVILADAITEYDISSLIKADRHIEQFMDLDA